MSDPRLQSFVERYERLAEERKSISGDMGEVLTEADGVGYDKAAVRRLVAWRATDAATLQEREITDELYRAALTGGPKPALDGVEPIDPLLQRAIALYRTGATVREVQAALKAEGRKVALGTAHKLKRRAKPFLDAEKEAAAKASRPMATVHVHPSVNVNMAPNDLGTAEPVREMVADDLGDPLLVIDKERAQFKAKVRAIAATVKMSPLGPVLSNAPPDDDLAFPAHLDRRVSV